MKFKTRIAMESNPGFDMTAALAPFGVQGVVQGGGAATIGTVSIAVSEIPVRLTIPFLKRRRPPLFMSIGRFRVTLSPIRIHAEGIRLEMEGVVGTKGVNADIKGKIDCRTEMIADGTCAGRIGTTIVAMGDDEAAEWPPLTHKEKEP